MPAARGPGAVAPSSGPSPTHNPYPHPAGRADETSGPRCVASHVDGGRSLSVDTSAPADAEIPASAPELLDRPTSLEPRAAVQGWQPPLLDGVSPVAGTELRRLAMGEINRLCREVAFDWWEFRGAWTVDLLASLLQDKCAYRRLVERGADVPFAEARAAVQEIIDLWDANPELRPSAEGDLESKRNGGRKSGNTRRGQASNGARIARILRQRGCSVGEIARLLGRSDRTIRTYLKATTPDPDSSFPPETTPADPHRKSSGNEVGTGGPAATGDGGNEAETKSPPVPFAAPEIPRWERWPARQFSAHTGRVLDAGDARRLCDLGRCAEAEGPASVDHLIAAIRAAAGPDVRDPWAYLETAWHNRGDAWTVPAQLLADAVIRAGEGGLDYALRAIQGGHVRRPVAYLRRVSNGPEGNDIRPPERPAALAVAMARRLAPDLTIVDAGATIAAETDATAAAWSEYCGRALQENRRRWPELFPDLDPPSGAAEKVETNCQGYEWDDLNNLRYLSSKVLTSSSPEDSSFPLEITPVAASPPVVPEPAGAIPEPAPFEPLRRRIPALDGCDCGVCAYCRVMATSADPERSEPAPPMQQKTPRARAPAGSMSPPVSRPAAAPDSSETAGLVREKSLQEEPTEPPPNGTLTKPMSTPAQVKRGGNEAETTAVSEAVQVQLEEPASPPLPRRNCPSKLVPLLAARLDLDAAVQAKCPRPGCRCRHYTAGGKPRDCPCHLAPSQAARLLTGLLKCAPPDWS